MKIILLIVLNILLIRTQIIFLNNLIIFEIPLLITLWYFLNTQEKPSYGIFFSTFIGLISDYLFGYPLGLYGFSLTFTNYTIYHLYNKLYIRSRIILFFFFLLSHIINSSIFYFLTKVFAINILRDFFLSFLISSIAGSLLLSFIIKKR